MAEKPLYDESEIYPIVPENKPAEDTPEYEELQEFSKEVVFLLQTVNDTEYNAALSVLKPPSDSFPGPVIFPMPNMVAGKLDPGWKVALVKTRPGKKVGKYVKNAVKKYPNTRFVIGVGVCFAFVRQAEVKLGDVLVSKVIHDFNYMKFEDKKIKDLGQRIDVVHDLQEIFCTQAKRNLKFDVSESRKSVMHCVPFLCNTFLIKDAKIRDAFHELNSGNLGGEMEGGELMQLQDDREVEGIIIIKGVADFADKDKNKHWQYTAAKAALHYIQVQLLNTDQSDFCIHNKKIAPISAMPTQRGAALPSSSSQVDTDSGMDDTASPATPTKLSAHDLTRITGDLRPYAHKWKDIGRGLGFIEDELNNIGASPANYCGGISSYLSAMLSDWGQWVPGDTRGSTDYATLDTLKIALDKAGLAREAQKLHV